MPVETFNALVLPNGFHTEQDNLVDWIDQLRTNYSLPTSYTVPPCWPPPLASSKSSPG